MTTENDQRAESHYEAAQAALAADDFTTAKWHLSQAIDAAPQAPEYVEALGALLAEVGPAPEAIAVLHKAVKLSPYDGHEKFMYLGQLLKDEAAAQAALRQGVAILQKSCEREHTGVAPGGQLTISELRLALCCALCALGERLIQAEASLSPGCEAEELLQRAAEADPSSPEPLQALAALQVEQGKPEAALKSLHTSLAIWHPPFPQSPGGSDYSEPAEKVERRLEDLGMQEQHSTNVGGRGEAELPSLEFRFQTARLLLELESNAETAEEILEEMLEEDDSAVDAWYLLALSRHAACHYEEARHALEQAQAKHAQQQQQTQHASPCNVSPEDFYELTEAIKESEQAMAVD